MPKYIIEHLEPKLSKWCLIEYENISKLVGKKNLIFTNIKESEQNKLASLGKVYCNSISNLNLKNICILDPDSNKTLSPKDKLKFNYFVFGGILGDYPPKKRTKKELTQKITQKIETRNIGKKQMSTDNAVYTVKKILAGIPLKNLPFKYKISIPISKFSSVELPYQYNLINNKPFMSKKVIQYLKNKKGF